MVELNDVSFTYGCEVDGFDIDNGVKNISMSVAPGECVVLCGRSGCGKSTVLRLINSLAPSVYTGRLRGTVHVAGQSVSSLSPEQKTRLMGVVLQDPRSQFFMTNVRDEIAFSAENLGIATAEIRDKIQRIAEQTGITHLLNYSLHALSSGQKQKVAIAAAALLSPPLLILDEPTANLDEASTRALLEVLKRLKQNGTTLIISEHRLHSLLPVADRYVYLEKGRLARIWTTNELAQMSIDTIRGFGLRHPRMGEMSPTKRSPSLNQEIILEGKGLTYRYTKANAGIEDIHITLPRGRVTALVGENGAGKTTLCKILCGLIRQQKGNILYGNKVASPGLCREKSYLVMQDADYQLYADSVGGEITLGKNFDQNLKGKAYDALNTFGLMNLKERHPASLSGGEKQRVIIAAAYCSDADFIVLDEPTSGLDGDSVLKVGQWVRALAQAKRSVIIITHDRVLSELACDYMMELTKTENRQKHAYNSCLGEQGVKESVFGKISDVKYLA